MNALDILFAVPLLLFAWRGFSNGFVKEMIRIIGFIVAAFLAFNYAEALLPTVKGWGINDQLAPFIAAFLIFAGCSVVVEIITRLLNKLVDVTLLTIPNKLLGAAFGALKVGLIFSFIYIFLAGFKIPDEKTRQASLSYPYLIQVVPVTYNIISSIYPGADGFVETVKKNLPEADAKEFKKFFE
jgi:membrane protein required for colicin V production